MRVVVSGGGTAGHINPALALAEVLADRGCTVDFAGTPQGVEARLVPQAGVPFTAFEASGFNRRKPATIVSGIGKIMKSTKLAKAWFAEIKPDVVVGFGGYVSIPVARAALSLGIPVVVHEQNSVMGMANKYLAKRAKMVCLTYECTADSVEDASKVRVTGNPVRSSVLKASREAGREMLGLAEDEFMLLVFGGSLGARQINDGIAAMKDEILSHPSMRVVHITGPKELDRVSEAMALSEAQAARWQLMGYQDRMGETLAAADAIVSRAGATSLAEISALAIPALLLPYPYATEDHQTTNAKAYVEAGCALMLPDSEALGESFKEKVRTLLHDARARDEMRRAAREQKTADAAANLADVVMEAAGKAASATIARR